MFSIGLQKSDTCVLFLSCFTVSLALSDSVTVWLQDSLLEALAEVVLFASLQLLPVDLFFQKKIITSGFAFQ